jgi:hypothetical protein
VVRPSRGIGAAGLGGTPLVGARSLHVVCRSCGAQIGERCRVYKVEDGVRLYIKNYRRQSHPGRAADARE